MPIAGEALIGLGDLYRELNELDKATDTLLEGIELNLQWRDAAAIDGYISLARVKQAQGPAVVAVPRARENIADEDPIAVALVYEHILPVAGQVAKR